MDENLKIWLPPMLTLLGTLIVVTFTAWLSANGNNKRFDDLSKLITAESARLEAVLRLEIAAVANRVKALEDRAGLIYQGRG